MVADRGRWRRSSWGRGGVPLQTSSSDFLLPQHPMAVAREGSGENEAAIDRHK